MATKKTFEAIAARLFHEARPWVGNATYETEWRQYERDVCAIADVLASTNPRFDRARFYRACGVEVK